VYIKYYEGMNEMFRRGDKSKTTEKKEANLPSEGRSGTTYPMSSGLKVTDDKFYLLTKKQKDEKETLLYSDIMTSSIKIKEYLKSGVKVEDIELMLVKMKADEFEVESIPWSKIAVELILTL